MNQLIFCFCLFSFIGRLLVDGPIFTYVYGSGISCWVTFGMASEWWASARLIHLFAQMLFFADYFIFINLNKQTNVKRRITATKRRAKKTPNASRLVGGFFLLQNYSRDRRASHANSCESCERTNSRSLSLSCEIDLIAVRRQIHKCISKVYWHHASRFKNQCACMRVCVRVWADMRSGQMFKSRTTNVTGLIQIYIYSMIGRCYVCTTFLDFWFASDVINFGHF